MIIAVDFDGTIVTHQYPEIGEDIGAFPILKQLIECGHQLILYTMRSGDRLQEAIDHCASNGIEFIGHNINPTQSTWTDSPKVYAHMYIDDAALGTPLVHPFDAIRPYVNWNEVKVMLMQRRMLS